MKTWIFETGSESALLALYDGDSPLCEIQMDGGPNLSKSIASHVQSIIARFPPPYGQIIIGSGPGSYTGLRVGAALAQALSFGWKIPLLSAPSLSAFAPAEPAVPYAILLDARLGGLYLQLPDEPARKISLEEAPELLRDIPLLLTPHPEKLKQRLPSLSFSHAAPRGLPLLRSAQQRPLELLYL